MIAILDHAIMVRDVLAATGIVVVSILSVPTVFFLVILMMKR